MPAGSGTHFRRILERNARGATPFFEGFTAVVVASSTSQAIPPFSLDMAFIVIPKASTHIATFAFGVLNLRLNRRDGDFAATGDVTHITGSSQPTVASFSALPAANTCAGAVRLESIPEDQTELQSMDATVAMERNGQRNP
ncbi:unnamed protein product [Echinostoma caproni]|uniref:Uncharacterized protein n=1 Tax=Echinostoma caproni TaxID=27848 RepID=A0A183AS63_9TREM|nr:unnamed protein product [Echinostoma caproni]